MAHTPRVRAPDSTLPLLVEGYPYIHRRRKRFASDAFRGRLLFKPAVFMGGEEAAQLFYDESRFRRGGVMPSPVEKTLFGEGGVQGLDDAQHRHRKAMFMGLMTEGALRDFVKDLGAAWERRLEGWAGREVKLIEEAEVVLCDAICRFCGLGVAPRRVESLARECAAMIDGFPSPGPRWFAARAARKRAEAWAEGVIRDVRAGRVAAQPGRAARVFATAEGFDGEPLPVDVAAVELLNVIRPTVAIGRFVAFAALALHEHPIYQEPLREEPMVEGFAQELRRYYPFTPLLAAGARRDFEWNGVQFRVGDLAVLDVWGTNHDPRLWDEPERFWPERFVDRAPSPYNLVPQGGGTFLAGHRCAGEWLTIEALKESLRFLARRVRYRVPAQDLSVSLSRVPAKPKSGVILTDVEALARRAEPPAVVARGAVPEHA